MSSILRLMDIEKVAIIKGTDPRAMTKQALKLIHAKALISTDDRVLIKPNYITPKHPTTGVTTDSRVVDGIIEFVKDCGASEITIGEGGDPETDLAFDITGIRDVASRQGVKLVNLNKDEGVKVTIPSGRALKEVKIAKTVLDSTCIVNVPKLKIHHMAQVTLSIKNLMGVMVGRRGAIMHSRLDEKLVDLASLIKPKVNVIDGIVGSEMHETRGRPVPMNLVVAGTDMVATDAIGSAIMGIDPSTVRHIQLAVDRGLGIGDLKAIAVLGESIEAVGKKFRREFSKKQKLRSYGLFYFLSDEVLRNIKKVFLGK